MSNNEFMYAVERSDEYLAHYGILGMKWGVRRAIKSGNSARLGKQYAKAQKKLAKLEKQAGKSKKYARRAALMGAGAAAAGGLAAAGTGGVARGISAIGGAGLKASRGLGGAMANVGRLAGNAALRIPGRGNKLKNVAISASQGVRNAGVAMQKFGANGGAAHKGVAGAANAVAKWGRENSVGTGIQNAAGKYAGKIFKGKNASFNTASRDAARKATSGIAGMSNNTIARIGAGAVGAGLAVGAARNAYKAATAQKRAAKFRSAMNESFKGTKYANGGQPRQGNKKRRRK